VKRLVFVTQAADPSHPVLGATLAKIRALAARVDEVAVFAGTIVPSALPENCTAHTFAASSQAARGARFVAGLAGELRKRPQAVVIHMSPVYALLAAPMTVPLRVPILLWFTQHAAGAKLRAAERVVHRILTVDARSVPIASPKVRAIGHGIDVAAFPRLPPRQAPLRRLLGLGRYAPVKDWETVLRALPELPNAALALHGPMLTEGDRAHRPRLEALARDLGVEARVGFGGPVPYAEVPGLFAASDAVVNATRGNAADKVVYEAAAACLPAFAASPVFDGFLPDSLRFTAGEAASLAAQILGYTGGAGLDLRARVEAEHSVDHWADGVLREVG
jgi:glycosyltransferase involved in cell wall biosynthesis